MSQIALPLSGPGDGPPRIVVGNANQGVIEAFRSARDWPYRTAILTGPPRSGKSLLARWFAESGAGDAVDDAPLSDETELFHRWNRAQESGRPLLLTSDRPFGEGGWAVRLPDLASRLGPALRLEVEEPDELMMAELIELHAQMRGLSLDHSATAYLVPRAERSHLGIERLVAAIDRLSLERKQPPTLAVWRDALAEIGAGNAQG